MDPSDWEQVGSIRDSENNGVMVSNLPLLFANSDITSLMVMTQRQLEKFVLFMVRCSVGEDVRKPWDMLIKPEWWPSKLPFRVPAGLSIAPSHRSMLQKLVERCYQYHGCEFLLQFCRSLVQQKPPGGYKFADNRDGTTSMFNSESGKLLVTFRNENREYDKINQSAGQAGPPVPRLSARPQLLPRRGSSTPSMVVKPDIHDVYLCDRCDMEFNTLSQVQAHERICLGDDQVAAANRPQITPENEEDLPDLLQDDFDTTDQATRMYQLGLIAVGTRSQLPPNSPVKWSGTHPLFQSSVRRVPSRNNYLKFDSVDVSSPLGCLLRRQIRRRESSKNGEGHDPSSVNGQLNVLKYERFLPASPDVQFPAIRDNARGLTRFVNVYRDQKLPWYHTYAFTKKQKYEKILNTEHGLLEEGINLYLSCKPCTVVVTKVPKRVIDRETHRQEKKVMPCIDLTEEEGKSTKQNLSKSSLVDQMLNFFRGKCQWALAPGFLEHVISGGNVPNNPVAQIFQQLFSPTGVLVLLLGEAIRNCNWSQHALAEYGTLQLTLEQHNNLLVKLGILNDVAVKFGSSKPMTDLVIKYNFILSNPDEMVKLTTITPDITQVSNPKLSSLLSQSNSAKHSPSSSGVAKSIRSNHASQPGPKFHQNNNVNSIGRKNSNSFAPLQEDYISTAQIASANRNLSYNVKEFIQAVEKDVSVIDVIDLSSDDESENLKPAKKFKANNSVNSSFNNLDVRNSHVRYNNGTNCDSMSSVKNTSTKTSDVTSKNGRSHWSISRNRALGRKATDFPETNGSSSVQTSSKLSNVSVVKPVSSNHALQSLRLSTLPSSMCNNNYLADGSDLEEYRESFLRDSSEVLDKRKVKRRLINGYDSEYEVETVVSPSKKSRYRKRLNGRSRSCLCDLHGCSCRKYRDCVTFSEEISTENNNNGLILDMHEVELESNASDVYIDEDVTVRLPSPVKQKDNKVSKEIASTESDDSRNDGTVSSLNTIFSSFNSYLNKGFGLIRNAVASTPMLETILSRPTTKDKIQTKKKSGGLIGELKMCSEDECKELNGVKELMEISNKLGDKRLTRGVSHQNLLKIEFETVAEELPLKIATDAVLEISDLLSISEVNTRDEVEQSFVSSNTSISSGYQTDLKLSKDIEPRLPGIMDSIKKCRTTFTDRNENASGDLLEKSHVVNAVESGSAIDVSKRKSPEFSLPSNGVHSSVSHSSDSSDNCPLSSESKRSYYCKRRTKRALAGLTVDEFKELSNSPFHPKRISKKILNGEVNESGSTIKRISTEMRPSSKCAQPTINNVFEILSKEWGPDESADYTDVEDNTDESEDEQISSKEDKQPLGKKRKMSNELLQLVADECKEFKQFGFHPGDVVFKMEEFSDKDSSSSDDEVVVNLNSPTKLNKTTDNIGSGKISKELLSLLQDEYKEFRNRSNGSARHKENRMIVSKRQPFKTTAPRTAKKCRVFLGFSPRIIQRELVHQENSMCSYTYTLPII